MSVFTQTAKKGDGAFVKAPPGNHPAVLVAIVDMGTQWQDGYQGAPGKWQRRAYFVWELVTKKIDGQPGRNHLIGIDLTVSFNEKAKLRKWVEARTGKAIPDGTSHDILAELGQPCLLNVMQKGDFPKIEAVSAIPDGLTVPPAKQPLFSWSLEDHARDDPISLPDWLPWFYGKPLVESIGRCREIAGDQGHGSEASEPVQPNRQPPAAVADKPKPGEQVKAAAPPAAGPAPRRPAGPPQRRFWVEKAPGVNPVLMTESELVEWGSAGALAESEVQVNLDGDAEWKPAADYGVNFQIPF